MKNSVNLALFFVVVSAFFSSATLAQNKSTILLKKSNSTPIKNALYIEALGRGGLYSIGYERHTSSAASFGLGYSFQQVRLSPLSADGTATLQTLPIFSNIYLPLGSHRPFITAGATIVWFKSTARADFNDLLGQFRLETQKDDDTVTAVTADPNVPSLSNSVEAILAIPNLGLGYEFKMKSGAFIRSQLIGFITDKPFAWFGLAIGVGF